MNIACKVTAVGVMKFACLLVIVAMATADPILRYHVGDSGHATNCGSVNFTASWTPKVVSGYKPLTIDVDYTLPHTFDGAIVNYTVLREDTIFLQGVQTLTCDDIQEVLPCPFPEGVKISQPFTIDETKALRGFPGTYKIILEVKNMEQQEMICLKAVVTISNN